MKKFILLALAVTTLAGCSTENERLAKCEAQGVSKDACYVAEQNRTTAINAAAEKQALDNAANTVQYAQTSHKHREELAKSGCTQVQEASAECDLKAPKASGSYKQISNEAEYVMNKPISDSAEYLLSKGWKPNQGEWHKSEYILRLVVENEKVVNSQLTK